MKNLFKIGFGCLGFIFVILLLFIYLVAPNSSCTNPFCDDFNRALDENPVYLDSNGVTVKAKEWAKVGYIGEIDGLRYEIVDLEGLKHYASFGQYLVTKDNKFRKDFIYEDLREGQFKGIIGINGQKHKKGDPLMFPCTSLITDMSGAFAMRNNLDTEIGLVTTTNLDAIVDIAIAGGSLKNIKGKINSVFIANTNLYLFDKMSTFDVSNVTNMKNLFWLRGLSEDERRGNWIYDAGRNYSLGYPDLSHWDISNVDQETLQMSDMPADNGASGDGFYSRAKRKVGYIFDLLPYELRPKE